MEDSLAVSYHHTLTMWSSNCILLYLSKWVENLCSHENLQTNVYSRILHNFRNLETTKIPWVSEWINKLWYIQIMKCYSTLKRFAIKSWKDLEPQMHITKQEKPIWKKLPYRMIPTIWCVSKGNTVQTGKRSVIIRVEGRDGVEEGWLDEHRRFLGQWNHSVWCCKW